VMYKITRKFTFDAGHRIYGHESKCAHVHGHTYTAYVTCAPDHTLDDLGRVVDFSVVKKEVGAWIDQFLDHGMILCTRDPLVQEWRRWANEGTKHKVYMMTRNPTAENIAELIYVEGNRLLNHYGVHVVRVKIQETPNCSATYEE